MNKYELMKEISKLSTEDLGELNYWIENEYLEKLNKDFRKVMISLKEIL